MNGAPQTASPFLDEPWRRFAWIAPLSVLLWVAALFCFSILLRQTAPPLPELKPLEARIVELPAAGGLQGGPAAVKPHPAAVKPHPAIVAKPVPVPVIHPRTIVHNRAKIKPIVPPVPPSPTGTSKSEAPIAPASPATSTGASTEGEGALAGSGSGSGSGMGSDSGGARAIYSPVPKIPDDLREVAFEAVAVAHFLVSYDGKVKVNLARPTSDPRLNQILLSTLEQWRFFPAMKGGVAIDSEFDVRIPITVQ
jgi:periplasmic protein TonB